MKKASIFLAVFALSTGALAPQAHAHDKNSGTRIKVITGSMALAGCAVGGAVGFSGERNIRQGVNGCLIGGAIFGAGGLVGSEMGESLIHETSEAELREGPEAEAEVE